MVNDQTQPCEQQKHSVIGKVCKVLIEDIYKRDGRIIGIILDPEIRKVAEEEGKSISQKALQELFNL